MKLAIVLPFIILLLVGISLLYAYVSELMTQLRLLFINPEWIELKGLIVKSYAEQVIIPSPAPRIQPVYMTQTFLELHYSYKKAPFIVHFNEKEFFWGELEVAEKYMAEHFPKDKSIPLFLNLKDENEVVMHEKNRHRNKTKNLLQAFAYLLINVLGVTMVLLGGTGILTQLHP